LERGEAIIFGGFVVIEGEAFAVFVEIAKNELGIGLILRGAGLKPGKRLIVARGGGIGRDEEFFQLEASSRVAGICAGCEFGDDGCGERDRLAERRRESGRHGEQRATNSEKESENAVGAKSESRHFDPLIRVLCSESCDPDAA